MENIEINKNQDNNLENLGNEVIDNKLGELKNNIEDPDKKLEEYNKRLEEIKKFEGREILDLKQYEILKQYDPELFIKIIDFHTELINYVIYKKGEEEITLKDISSQKNSFILGEISYMYNNDMNKLIKAYGKSDQKNIDRYKPEVIGFQETIMKVINNKRNFKSGMK